MDMERCALIVILIMCSEVVIGHRSISRDIKYRQEKEHNLANLDAPIKSSGWGIKDPIDIDSNSYDSYEPDNSEYDSREQGGYHVVHHGGYHGHHAAHHGHHGRNPDWKNNDRRTTAKPKRRPIPKPLYKNVPASTFNLTPMSKLLLTPVSGEKSSKATSDSPRTTTSTITTTSGNNTSLPNLSDSLKNESTRSISIPVDSITSSPLPDIQICIRNCPTTPEYNPVCGTNNVTYNNPGRLDCAKMCGVEVQLWKQTTCANENIASVTSTNPTTASTNEWAKNIAVTPSSTITQCIQKCYTPTNYGPVCGTDGITYSNSGYLLCAQFCGLDVKLKNTGACSSDDRQSISLPTPIQLCVNTCPKSPLNSPVCSSNGVTYKNPMQLLCHRVCGVDVQHVPCIITHTNTGNMNNPVPPTTVNNTSSYFTAEDCIKVCPQTLDYNPVCGTNDVTYRNPVHLGCARLCGVTVEVKSKSPCESSAIPTDSPINSSTIAITGNKEDNGTTGSHQGGFTIPPDVLATIFDSLTTVESDNFEIDPRFQS